MFRLKTNLAITLFSIAAVLFCYYFLIPKFVSDKGFLEIAQASIWSDLQGIEFQHRLAKELQVPVLLRGAVDSGKYDVLGVSGKNARTPIVWIVLNTNAGPNGIYIMPTDVDFILPCSYLRDLASREMIDNKVLTALQSHCTDSSQVGSGILR